MIDKPRPGHATASAASRKWGGDITRLEALSDATFAIAVTLLVVPGAMEVGAAPRPLKTADSQGPGRSRRGPCGLRTLTLVNFLHGAPWPWPRPLTARPRRDYRRGSSSVVRMDFTF